MSTILVAGGAGYIGSHMCVELLQAGHEVIVVDNLSNSSAKSLAAVERITQRSLEFHEVDLRDSSSLSKIFSAHDIESVLHFAGLKAVGESVSEPMAYYDNNVVGSLRLVDTMAEANVRKLVFSSSATVYGVPEEMPITESFPTGPINPYGQTKLHVENMLTDIAASNPDWRISLLRYFNPVGAHASGEIGENPNGIPNNLVPFISQVAVGRRPHLNVFANDYPTPDGTGIRDYIHVVDLVRGHMRALEFLEQNEGIHVHNLGTGQGYSVMQMIRAFEVASGKEIKYEIVDRRPGDAAESYADPSKAERELDWKAELGIERMCQDVWRWQSNYPNGFEAL
jgi:UDP-glucose 4-epimerase